MKRLILGAYLDPEEKFYDYRTSEIVVDDGSDLFDTSKTGTSYGDDFLDPSQAKYLADNKNRKGTIVYMTPEEYFERCAHDIFHTSVETLKIQRGEHDRATINHLKEVVIRYRKRFPLTYIDYAANSQEGLHRMLTAGELYGWDVKFPVLVIEVADEERAKKHKIQRDANDFKRYDLEKCVEEVAFNKSYPENADNWLTRFVIDVEDYAREEYDVDVTLIGELSDDKLHIYLYLTEFNDMELGFHQGQPDAEYWVEDIDFV